MKRPPSSVARRTGRCRVANPSGTSPLRVARNCLSAPRSPPPLCPEIAGVSYFAEFLEQSRRVVRGFSEHDPALDVAGTQLAQGIADRLQFVGAAAHDAHLIVKFSGGV